MTLLEVLIDVGDIDPETQRVIGAATLAHDFLGDDVAPDKDAAGDAGLEPFLVSAAFENFPVAS